MCRRASIDAIAPMYQVEGREEREDDYERLNILVELCQQERVTCQEKTQSACKTNGSFEFSC